MKFDESRLSSSCVQSFESFWMWILCEFVWFPDPMDSTARLGRLIRPIAAPLWETGESSTSARTSPKNTTQHTLSNQIPQSSSHWVMQGILGFYPVSHKVFLYIPGGAGFCPSAFLPIWTVRLEAFESIKIEWDGIPTDPDQEVAIELLDIQV